MNSLLHPLRARSALRARLAACLLLLLPLCSAACGGHVPVDAPDRAADVHAHAMVDCHGAGEAMAHGDADGDAPGDTGQANEHHAIAADGIAPDGNCCDDASATILAERLEPTGDLFDSTVAVASLAPTPVHDVVAAAPDPEPGGRSPGRTLRIRIASLLE